MKYTWDCNGTYFAIFAVIAKVIMVNSHGSYKITSLQDTRYAIIYQPCARNDKNSHSTILDTFHKQMCVFCTEKMIIFIEKKLGKYIYSCLYKYCPHTSCVSNTS